MLHSTGLPDPALAPTPHVSALSVPRQVLQTLAVYTDCKEADRLGRTAKHGGLVARRHTPEKPHQL
jgi:hypothetical protein